ncbi:MAG: hypothetical protein WDN24_02455 [Sphingomonas sp.]
MIIFGLIVVDNLDTLRAALGLVMTMVIAMNVLNLLLALLVSRLGRLNREERIAVVIEHLIRQEATAIYVAVSILGRSDMSLPMIVNTFVGMFLCVGLRRLYETPHRPQHAGRDQRRRSAALTGEGRIARLWVSNHEMACRPHRQDVRQVVRHVRKGAGAGECGQRPDPPRVGRPIHDTPQAIKDATIAALQPARCTTATCAANSRCVPRSPASSPTKRHRVGPMACW